MKDRQESIFDGCIEHFSTKPGGLAVDWFKDSDIKNLYFISHAHSDHIPVLLYRDSKFNEQLKRRPNVKIYCTAVTRDIIVRLPKADDVPDVITELKQHFVVLEPDETKEINFFDNFGNVTGQKMKVRTIPANHIPGAVMFLFDDGEKRALYTGDFRYDIREDNDDMRALKNFVETYDENIDYLYVDITCMDIGKLYHPDQNKLPSRPEITKTVFDLIKDKGPSSVHIDVKPLGAEGMVKSVAEFVGTSSASILEKLEDGSSSQELYKYLLRDARILSTKSAAKTDIHIFSGSLNNTAKHLDQEDCKNCDSETLRIRATLEWFRFLNQYFYSDRETWSNHVTENLKREDRDFWQVLYSNHSSDAELREFLSYFNFKEVFPINDSFERRYIKNNQPASSKYRHTATRKSLFFSLESSSLYNKYSKSTVLWLTGEIRDLRANLSDKEFQVFARYFQSWQEILSEVEYQNQQIDFIVISCTIELHESLGELYKGFFGFIDALKKVVDTNVILFYSTINNMNDKWKNIIDSCRLYRDKKVSQVFYIDLTKIPEYTASNNPKTHIILETLKNLIRNQDKEVFVSDWPMPYEFSERKREYHEKNPTEPEGQDI